MNSEAIDDPYLPEDKPKLWPEGPWAHLKQQLRGYRDDLVILAFITLALVIFLLPTIIHSVPSGHVAVRWHRFGEGTDTGPPSGEGTVLTWPWDSLIVYDIRLKQVERQIEALSSDGLTISLDLVWHYRLVRGNIGKLHKYVGIKYEDELLNPTITARARDVISLYRPDEIYTERRLQIQNEIARAVRYELTNNFNPDPAADCAKISSNYDPEKCKQVVQWFALEDVLIKGITLPKGVQEAIVRKATASHEVDEYTYKIAKEEKEADRKRIEALGIRNFQEIVSNTMSDSYLKWRGIEATLALANSPNAKIVVIGNSKNGLPLIMNTEDHQSPTAKKAETAKAAASESVAAAAKTEDMTHVPAHVTSQDKVAHAPPQRVSDRAPPVPPPGARQEATSAAIREASWWEQLKRKWQ
ncbi:prohibitin family protein [Parachitinimonas caeni]|uniref:Prohibitin family protein n=1 Tax=Parachitinimonas caeni TaxID=3031301 RepID=A0ABT7DWF9_9NEIS|nr:prohibitin family protein [Parachitinimonas caeni]MDK2124399.1 prohibitin family protein [Parachitinimonas caeni]